MSLVTNVILSFDTLEDEAARLADVNEALARNSTVSRGSRFFPRSECDHCDGGVGGTKHLEHPTFIAAFNHLALAEFEAALRSIGWEHPEHVQLLVCGQEDELYREALAEITTNPVDRPRFPRHQCKGGLELLLAPHGWIVDACHDARSIFFCPTCGKRLPDADAWWTSARNPGPHQGRL